MMVKDLQATSNDLKEDNSGLSARIEQESSLLEVDIVFRQTPHVPLLGGRLVPTKMHHAVAWDMG